MKYSRPRGTQDILPPEVYRWRFVEQAFWETLASYGYEPVRTPIFESTDLFLRSVGEGSDIVSKEMYTFADRGGRSITLRPENTAAVVRAFLENGLQRRGGVTRFGYIGPMFRYDRPQAGRYRQFHQVGAEAIGTQNPAVDVEMIDVVMTGLERLGFDGLSVRLNSVGCRVCREPYVKELRRALDDYKDKLCEDCQHRSSTNPMRVFDCKKCESVKTKLPAISDQLCGECADHFANVTNYMERIERTFTHDRLLVRGLDYYTKTAFEILHGELGAQNALCGGGRYDDLIEQCGGPSMPAVGFSAGLERIISVLPAAKDREIRKTKKVDVYIACTDDALAGLALSAAKALRQERANVEVDGTFRPLKKQLKAAEQLDARVTLIVDVEAGDDGTAHAIVKWKDMGSREQYDVQVGDLSAFAQKHLGK